MRGKTHPLFNARVFAWLAWVSVFLFASSLLQGNVAHHNLFIKQDGSLWGMGRNDYGQLADSNHSNKLSPQQIDAGPVIACASGGHHTLFVKADFTLWTVGRNSHGQLGDNTGVDRNQSVQVATDVVAVAAGGYHSLFTKKDGSLWGMGDNGWKQLGFAGANPQSPAQLLDGNVSKIACGWSTTMFLKKDGAVWGSGVNSSGQLGTGTSDMPTAFVQATSIGTEGADIAISNVHSLVVKKDGSLWGSGQSQYGQLFTLPATGNLTHSSLVGSGVRSTSAGAEHSTYLKSDNTLWAVGSNQQGQLGNGTYNDLNASHLVSTGIVQVKSGSSTVLFLDENGTLRGMGNNDIGQVGDGSSTQRITSPVQIATDVLRLEGTFNNAHAVDLNATANLEMIWVEPGSFTMGSPTSEPDRNSEETEHNVTLTKGFYLGKYEVTQAQYQLVMTGNPQGLDVPTSGGILGPNMPVNHLSYEDIQVFLQRLNDQQSANLPVGWQYALPTESQWEYACRAGTTSTWTAFNLSGSSYDLTKGDDYEADPQSVLDFNGSLANYNYGVGYHSKAVEVGQYPPNLWGFHDMHGNVWEWVADWSGAYPTVNQTDPSGSTSGTERVMRGGSFENKRDHQRSANRSKNPSSWHRYSAGFRLAYRKITTPPTDLNSTAPLTIAENQPIGTVVGEFNATDPDANSTLTYHLVSGAGDGNNSLFTLETNGTLKTATIFDYESNASTYAIRVKVKDEHNASMEKNFTVTLTDANDPPTGTVTISGTPQVGQTLTVSNNLADADGLGAISYQWYRDGQPIVFGGTLKDGVNGVDGLAGARSSITSADGMHVYVAGKIEGALAWFERNASTGGLTYGGVLKDGLNGVDGLNGALALTLSNDGKHLYAAAYAGDAVSWFERNATTGALSYLGVIKEGQSSGQNVVDGLDGVTSVTISADDRHLYFAGYIDDSLSWFDRNESNGALTYGGTLKDGVNGVDGLNNAYDVVLSVDDGFAYVAGHDEDSISWFERNASTGALSYLGVIKDGVGGADGLDGAMSLKLSPDGKHAYVVAALDSAVSWFERNATSGALTFGGFLQDGSGGADGLARSYCITVSADGMHAYVAGYDDHSVSWFDRNPITGALTFGGILKDNLNGVDGLDNANDVFLAPDGKHAYVTGYTDNAVSWFTRDPSTGALSYGSASDANYTLTAADAGAVITVVASYTDGGGTLETVSSAATSSVAAAPNSAPVITSYWGGATAAVSVLENQTFAADVNATDADVNATVSYLVGGGSDQSKFDLNSTTGVLTFKTAPDYENPTDADSNNTYVVQVNATDGNASVSQLLTVTVTDEVETSPSRPVVYVKLSAPGGGDGQSWATAYNQLRDALSNAPGSSDIWVAQGIYFASSSNAQSSFFTINSKDLRIYGGFAGNETSLTERDLPNNHTVLSADYGQNDSSDPIYTGSTRSENAHHVFWIEDSNATLDGLTIEGGNADLSSVNGMNNGGGVYAKNSNLKIFNCYFTLNSAVSYGGGIYTIGSETLVSNSVFFNNNGGFNGAGAVNIGQGGSSDTAKFVNTFFINNNAQRYGAVFVQSHASADFMNCVFAGNRSYTRAGSGAFASYGNGHNNLINCTFYDNSASPGEGVTGSANATFSNSVFWNNGSSALASATVVNSIVQNGYSGAGNLDQDPLFNNVSNLIGADGRWGTADDGLRLNAGSPAIDAGLLSNLVADFADLDNDGNFSEVTPLDVTGLARSPGANLSLGAYEVAAPTNAPPVITSYGGYGLPNSLSVLENQTFAADVNASDADGNATVSYVISGGSDQSKFDLNATTGVLTFKTAPDYEANASAAGNNTYTVSVTASDGEANATQTLTLNVTDVYESSQPPHLVDLNSTVNLEMIWVEPGTFTMGSPTNETGRSSSETEHNVTLTKGFYLGKYEVTQAQYQAVMAGNGNGLSATPSQYSGNPNRPVELVSWDDVQIFLARLNNAEQTAGRSAGGWSYVLPTESQWEYACRAGTTTAYSWGNTITSANANYNSNIGQTADVGQYAANPWGFFDMHGNVYEWVADRYGTYPTGPVTDPLGAASGSHRVERGGSWSNGGADLRSAKRSYHAPSDRHGNLGFRVGFQQVTTPPTNLNSVSALTVAENQPIGSIVGEFNATDPDANATLTYHLVSGAGDGNNSLFTLESNGTLKTATTFDYESNASTYAIRVKVKDEHNASMEGNFTVTLTDVLELVPQTISWGQDFSNVLVNQIIDLNASASSNLPITYDVNDTSVAELTVTMPGNLDSWWKMDEKVATTIADASGSGASSHTSMMVGSDGSTNWTAGKFGNSLSLDGTNDYARAFGYKGITGSSRRTLSLWFKTSTVNKTLLSYGAVGTGTLFQVSISSGGVAEVDFGGVTISGGSNLANGEWRHIAVTVPEGGDSGTAKLYVDGTVTNGSGATVINTGASNDLKIGTDGASYFSGQLDDVRLYNAELNASMIAKLYGGGVGDFNRLQIKSAGSVTITASQTGDGNYSAALDLNSTFIVDLLNQTISFSPISGKSIGDFDFDAGATASSTLPISYASSDTNIAQIIGPDSDGDFLPDPGSQKIRIRAAGTVTITASQAGDSIYNASTNVQQTLTINFYNLFPDSITGMEFWFDGNNVNADTSVDEIVDNSAFFIWNDLSGNTRNAVQGTAAKMGIYKANSLNGKGTIQFAADDTLDLSPAVTGVKTIFAVFKQTSGAAQTKIFGGDAITTAANGNVALQREGGAGLIDSAVTSSSCHVVTYEATAGAYALFVDGTDKGGNTDPQALGGLTKIGNNFAGDIAEIVAYDNVLSSITRQKIEGYLAHKWGLENQLPGNHPHKITLPSFGGAQTITFDPLANKTILDSSFELNASASSGLPVVYASSNSAVATVSGSTVTIVGAGVTTITASQSGNSVYLAATAVTQTLAVQVPNSTPSALNATAPLTIAENQPIGTVVGEFNASDPDVNATLTYQFVSGAGGTHNTLFILDANGTLEANATFDYESNASSYAIRIKVKDELNASMEGNYTVTLTDANDPVTGSVSISGTPQVEQTLTASNTLADPDGLGAITYQWYRDGVPINMLKDGVGGVDGLNATRGIILSADGKHAYVTGSSDSAVSWYERNASTGALTYGGMLKDDAGGVDGLNGAWDVTLSADGNHAYVTGFSDDAVSWYERNASTGALTYGGMLKDGVNGVDGLGGAWGVTLSADGNHAYVTGYFDFAVSWHERNASTGALTYGGLLKDGVGGVDGLGSASSVTLSADGNHAYVTGSTDDAVSWHERNASTGALTYGGMVKDGVNGVDGLGGAYNVTLSADGKHAYVTGSVDDAVSWYERNASTGALTYGGVLKDGVGGVDGLDNAFGVTLSADGKHAYVTGANDDAVSWYERNASTGALTYGGMLKDGVGGVDGLDSAFGVTLSADGNHAYVAGNYDDAVSWFTRDPGTGALSYVQTGATYVLTPADAGSVITAKASYTDGGSFEHNVTSAGTASVQPANSAPTDLNSTAPLTIAENQPIGTVVGVFIATDPDAGATLTYQFVSGVGDGNNSLFTLETNGTLKTATTFDYESNASTYAIRVKVKDEHNASMEGNFTVTLTNMYEPSQSNHVVDLNSTVNLEMIWVEPGSFTMGRDLPHAAYVAHLVTLTNGFYLGKHEVTKAQYETVMAGNPDGLSATPGNYSNPNGPAAGISWEHVQVFLSRLNNANSANIPVGWKYVLPTEAEWEYSCRAGSTTSYFWGNESNPGKANFAESGYGKAITVGSYQPNYWGFYDMHGNVREWTSDWKIGYTSSDQIDPVGAVSGTHRINRGGAWNSPASLLTSFIRINNFPNFASGAVGFRLAFKKVNTVPANLNFTAPLTIAENQSVGTVVGEFNATDPDVNATLTYQLVSGAGDGNNSLFTLDANGTLKTATTFDYETNVSTFSIRVQTKDEHNASVEGNFTVILTDVYEPPPDPGGNENNSTTESNQTGQSNPVGEYFRPLVETGQAEGVSRTSATLKGTVPDDGGSAISERGFLLSNKPNPRVDSSGVIRLVVDAGTSVFSASATNLQASKKYYFRAYATNAEGTGYGLEESFRTTFVPRGPSWIDAVPGTANNWWSSPWLGSFYLNANGWARHEKLGWVFPMESPTAGLWLWKEGLGWLWTNKEIYPFLYQNGNGGWLYFFGRRQETLLFYDYFTKRWITRNEGQ